ncbi:methylated-DNA--[protein]-cysteine S-methyltransferase [Chelativorans sp. YIM 93263]|uniref:methylated-DNA--[protein]-cysteine S-methyltransferase n=1 Tax=Chelativorans sp. YIM 93263 TaxID=2906648 RepID=UPI0023791C83|nr:methylated-DNA--[protein]-cysteine S-methyltransferase [Chelativorans sp. YIM 93263]
MSFHHVFETAFGFCGIVWSERGVCRFMLPVDAPAPAEEELTKRRSASSAATPSGEIAKTVAAVVRYFEGEREDFAQTPVDLDGTPPFHQAIYRAARRLAYGETTTYGALATEAGFPKSAQETGVALGRNPIPLIIPCHRILAAGGKLGGFSAPGGTATKQKMLGLEGAISPDAHPDQASFAF